MTVATPLLDIRNVTVKFKVGTSTIHAVNDITYQVGRDETLGIVGESGSGKSVHVLAMLGLIPKPPAVLESGSAVFEGRDLLRMSEAELTEIRGARIGMIFQDPMSSLNPVLTIGRQIAEPLMRHRKLSRAAALNRAAELLELVGIPEPRRRLSNYPFQFSGGMRQRTMIAIGIACEPRLLIADEATTALDVTVQAQILDIVRNLKKTLGMAVIWITHDLGVVAGLADTVQVMYAGRIMERGSAEAIFGDTRSAYTWGLLQSIPREDSAPARRLHQIPGAPPDMSDPPPGDPFAPRNPFATERCRREVPPLRDAPGGEPGHQVAAWYDLRDVKASAAREGASS